MLSEKNNSVEKYINRKISDKNFREKFYYKKNLIKKIFDQK